MSNILLRAAVGRSAAAEAAVIEDVFSTYTYTGNATGDRAITTGIDLSTKTGMVWTKARVTAYHNALQNTIGGTAAYHWTDATNGYEDIGTFGIKSFTTTGYTVGTGSYHNSDTEPYVSWSFAVADNFYYQASAVKAAGVDKTVDLSSLGTVGMVAVKRTDSTGDWFVWHRSCTAGKLLYLNLTDAEATLGHITVSGTTLTLEDGVIADGTYIVYAWAHDTGTDGLIQCGSFTTDAGGAASVTLGWELQYIIHKNISNTADGGYWRIIDSMRGMVVSGANQLVRAENSAAEASDNEIKPNATGFTLATAGSSLNVNSTYIYLAIRRGPMRQPTSGTQVYNAIARAGTGAAATVTGVGFPPDLVLCADRTLGIHDKPVDDRLRGANLSSLATTGTYAESAYTQGITSFSSMDGVSIGTSSDFNSNGSSNQYIMQFFRRYPGVFDEVCDTGTGSAHTIAHNLTVVPELMIRKKRSAADLWAVYAGDATDYLILNTTAATADLDTIWNDTAPTASVFTVGTHDDVNENTGTFVTYLFATLAGISKVGTYTGDGTTDSSKTINCGFSTGARFVLIKRTDNTGNWVVFDSTRGIVAGNDPYLLLNTTDAEDTDEDAIDTDNSGFKVNETTCAINTNNATYIYLAFA